MADGVMKVASQAAGLGRMALQADNAGQAEQPQLEASITFSSFAGFRGQIKRQLERYLDQQDGITYSGVTAVEIMDKR